MNDLKKAILEMERCAHEWEQEAHEKGSWESDPLGDAACAEEIAGLYRIAAACCWEKLERLEAGDGWRYPEKGELPADEGLVLAIVSGSPASGISLVGSYQTASYFANDPASWVIEEWPEWEDSTVHCWQPMPDAPAEIKKIWEQA